jgi:DNA segregation ATPase FtsK/SpoIIIE, S-DNA-T family
MAVRKKTMLLPAGALLFMRDRTIEAAGLALIALSTAFVLALLSHAPSDPSWNTAASADRIANLMGAAGSHVSDLTLQTLGLAGALLAPIAAGWGWRLWKEHTISSIWLRLALAPLCVLIAAMAFTAITAPVDWPYTAGLGGFAGALVFNQALEMLSVFGGALDTRIIGFSAGAVAAGLFYYVLGFSIAEWRSGASRTAELVGASKDAAQQIRGWPRVIQAFARATGQRFTPEERIEPTLDAPGAPRRTVRRDLVETKEKPVRPGRKATVRQRTLDLATPAGEFEIPALELLSDAPSGSKRGAPVNEDGLQQNARLLEGVLEDFGVRGEIIKVRPGPVVTLYELEPAPGTKTSRVIGLADDIARSMSAISVRIATVPGRSVIGIELPNAKREMVLLRELLSSRTFEDAKAKLPLVLGKDIGGAPVIVDLARMPHLLIAGTTGSGKSVGLNAMILSLLYRLSPDECKFIMIDPKMLELSIYDDIPHLISPVVTDPKKAVVALKWTVREMEERYRGMSKLGVRNIEGYNKRVADARKKGEVLTRKVQTGFDADTGKPVFEEQPLDLSPLRYLVVVVDEMADLMLVAGKDIEGAIQRLAQMARAAGIHLIMATQRPSVDVVTGTIKANFPTRISFQVTSKVDSRTILGEQGAEQLLGQGDMLYMAGGGRITRVHGPFVHDDEVESVVQHLKSQGTPDYVEAVTDESDSGFSESESMGGGNSGDELYDRAVALIASEGKASTSFIQRHLQIGYNRAARIIEKMEKEGVVSAANHVGKREILVGDHSELGH